VNQACKEDALDLLLCQTDRARDCDRKINHAALMACRVNVAHLNCGGDRLDGVFTLRSRFAWAYDFNPSRSVGATFQTLPGASFVVNGARLAQNSALTTVAAEMKWRNGWSAAASFEGEFSDVTRSYAGKGVVRYAW